MAHSQDPDDLYGDAVIAKLEICARRNGAMSVGGSIEDEAYALALLDNARDAVRGYHARKRSGQTLIVPAKDTSLKEHI